ncbi:MAG: discoidin domain-containing protein [Desulfovibrio sp.]
MRIFQPMTNHHRFHLLVISAAVCLCFFASASASAAQEETLSGTFSASSTVLSVGGESYGSDKLADGNSSTFWLEGGADSGVGEWVQVDFGRPMLVKGIVVYNGAQASRTSFLKHNRVKKLGIVFASGRSGTAELADIQGPQKIDLPDRATRSLLFEIRDVHLATRVKNRKQTALSRIDIIGEELPAPDGKTDGNRTMGSTVSTASSQSNQTVSTLERNIAIPTSSFEMAPFEEFVTEYYLKQMTLDESVVDMYTARERDKEDLIFRAFVHEQKMIGVYDRLREAVVDLSKLKVSPVYISTDLAKLHVTGSYSMYAGNNYMDFNEDRMMVLRKEKGVWKLYEIQE